MRQSRLLSKTRAVGRESSQDHSSSGGEVDSVGEEKGKGKRGLSVGGRCWNRDTVEAGSTFWSRLMGLPFKKTRLRLKSYHVLHKLCYNKESRF